MTYTSEDKEVLAVCISTHCAVRDDSIRMLTDLIDLIQHYSKVVLPFDDSVTESTFYYLKGRPCQETRVPKERLFCLYVTF